MSPTIHAIRKTELGTDVWQPGALNLHVSVPCPLKVRLKQALEPFIADFNRRHARPVYCPSLLDGVPHGLETLMQQTTDAAELPDVWVSIGLHTAFAQPFKQHFIDSGVYRGVTKPQWLPLLPPELAAMASKHNLGLLAFGFWQLVCDLSLLPAGPYPARWADLASPAYHKQLAIHGCDGHVGGLTLLQMIKDTQGAEAVTALAKNVRAVRHFSQLIKGLDSADPNRVPFNLMPGAAANQIPSQKRVAEVQLADGPLLSPLFLFVKAEAQASPAVAELLEFFWGETFRAVLQAGDYHMPDSMDWSQPYSFPDWDQLASADYQTQSEALNQAFMDALDPGTLTV